LGIREKKTRGSRGWFGGRAAGAPAPSSGRARVRVRAQKKKQGGEHPPPACFAAGAARAAVHCTRTGFKAAAKFAGPPRARAWREEAFPCLSTAAAACRATRAGGGGVSCWSTAKESRRARAHLARPRLAHRAALALLIQRRLLRERHSVPWPSGGSCGGGKKRSGGPCSSLFLLPRGGVLLCFLPPSSGPARCFAFAKSTRCRLVRGLDSLLCGGCSCGRVEGPLATWLPSCLFFLSERRKKKAATREQRPA